MASNSNPILVYWDSCTYLNYLKGDHPLHEQMQMVLDDWKAGVVRMATSALTIDEVLWVKCEDGKARMLIDRAREPEIIALFDPPPEQPFTLVELGRVTAMVARELVWDHGVHPKDAIHVASALAAHCPMFHTNDEDLWKLSGKLGASPPLVIQAPTWTRQIALTLPDVEPPPAQLPPGDPSG